jgi:hypothetical protein
MKKIYYLAGALLLSATANAQFGGTMVSAKNESVAKHSRPVNATDRAAGDPIGPVMNFSTPADWVMANTGTPSANWVIGTSGPSGGFSGGMGPIASTSGGNFAMFDSDALGSGSSVQNATITMANPVNLSAYSNVGVTFESYYRNFQGACYIGVSTDGVSFTDFQVHSEVLLNEGTDNPEVVALNISSVAANDASVWLRFRYEGGWDYAWMVDDVQLVEGYDDNLVIGQPFMYMGLDAWDYYMIPTSQVSPITFGVYATNNGVNNQTSTILNVVSNDGTTDVYDENSPGMTLPAFTSDTLEILTPEWTPSADGTYSLTYTISSSATDQDLSDNDLTLEDVIVGGNVYARDNGIITGAVSHLGSTNVPTLMGNYFDFQADFALGQVQVGIDDNSLEGEEIYAEVRIWDGTDFVYVEESNAYALTASDLGGLVTLTLQDVVNCQMDETYFIGVGHYGGEVWIMTAQVSDGVVIYNDGAASQQNSLFIVRGVEVATGIEENAAVTELSAYPNPASEMVTVKYGINTTANVSLVITDITGKVVASNDYGVQNQGNYSVKIDTENMSNGVYFYTLNVNGVTSTEKLTITKN